jgi:hypothetical protein
MASTACLFTGISLACMAAAFTTFTAYFSIFTAFHGVFYCNYGMFYWHASQLHCKWRRIPAVASAALHMFPASTNVPALPEIPSRPPHINCQINLKRCAVLPAAAPTQARCQPRGQSLGLSCGC